jgi:hypothetical protein
MRLTMCSLAGLLVAQTVAAQTGGGFDFRRDLAPGKRFYLQNIIGNVRVTGTSGRTVEVAAVKREGRHGRPEDVTLEVIDLENGVALCVRYPQQRSRSRGSDNRGSDGRPKNPCSNDWSGNHERNDTEVDFTVRVPSGLLLHIGTVSGDVAAERLEGNLELSSVSGDVRLAGGTGPSIELETVSGDVEILDGRAKEVYGHTVSGEVTFRGPMLADGSYEFATTSGNIDVMLPESPNAKLSAATFSGRFSSDLPTTQNEARRNRRRHNATWGNGSARLDLESLSGNIRITSGSR